MASSIKKNVFMSAINTAVTLLFPLITFPYVSRILAPEGIGQYDFIFSISTYFLLFAMLGVPLYARKKIASLRDNPEELRKVASSIFYLNLFLSIFVYAVYAVFAIITDGGNIALYLIIGLQIISTSINVDWYFQAREKFTFILVRNIAIKAISAVLLFCLIKDKSDITIYACIMIFSILAYAVTNLFIFVRKVKPSIKLINLKPHFKPILAVFLIYVASKINTNLGNVMLGYIKSDYDVGQYAVATKFINISVEVLLVVNAVMLPRIAYYLSEGNKEAAMELLSKAFKVLFALSLAGSVGLYIVSNQVVHMMSGDEFMECVTTMQIMCCNLLFLTIGDFFGIQILYAFNKVKQTTIAILIGTGVSVALNAILIPFYSYMGAGIASVAANFFIVAAEAVMVKKFCPINVFNKDNLKAFIACCTMTGVLVIIQLFVKISSNIVYFIIAFGVGFVVFGGMLLILRHSVLTSNLKMLLNKFKRRPVIQTVSDVSNETTEIETEKHVTDLETEQGKAMLNITKEEQIQQAED